MSSTSTGSGEDTLPHILVIYSTESELNPLLSTINSLPFSVNIENKTFSDLDDINVNVNEFDLIILLSSSKFDLDEDVEEQFKDYLNDNSKYFIAFSPYLDTLENEIELLLGFEEIGDQFPDNNVTTWDLEIEQNIGNLSIGETFTYTGQYAEIETHSQTQNLVSIISMSSNDGDDQETTSEEEEDSDELNLPMPAIINATTNGANIISSTLSPISMNTMASLGFNQLPQIFNNLIVQLYSSFIIQANTPFQVIQPTGSEIVVSSDITSQPKETDPENILDSSVSIPILPNIQIGNLVVYGFLTLILLIVTKFLGLLNWVNRRIIGVGIFVIGIFYNVEDRILNQKDVYLNNSRAEIIDFLDVVGKFGSHLREIKSMVNLGSGALMWHLKVLEDFNWIVKYQIENNTVYVSHNFETLFDPYLKKLELQLSSKYSHQLIQALSNISFSNSITVIDLQDQTDVPNKAIRRFVNKLNEMEIITVNHTKPIRFQVFNFSILKNLLDSMVLRNTYNRIQSDIQITENDQ